MDGHLVVAHKLNSCRAPERPRLALASNHGCVHVLAEKGIGRDGFDRVKQLRFSHGQVILIGVFGHLGSVVKLADKICNAKAFHSYIFQQTAEAADAIHFRMERMVSLRNLHGKDLAAKSIGHVADIMVHAIDVNEGQIAGRHNAQQVVAANVMDNDHTIGATAHDNCRVIALADKRPRRKGAIAAIRLVAMGVVDIAVVVAVAAAAALIVVVTVVATVGIVADTAVVALAAGSRLLLGNKKRKVSNMYISNSIVPARGCTAKATPLTSLDISSLPFDETVERSP